MKRGEVWFADLGVPRGHEQGGDRPVVILQNDRLNASGVTVIVPLTKALEKARFPVNVLIGDAEIAPGEAASVALCNQLRVIDSTRLRRKLGELPLQRLAEIEEVVAFVLALPN